MKRNHISARKQTNAEANSEYEWRPFTSPFGGLDDKNMRTTEAANCARGACSSSSSATFAPTHSSIERGHIAPSCDLKEPTSAEVSETPALANAPPPVASSYSSMPPAMTTATPPASVISSSVANVWLNDNDWLMNFADIEPTGTAACPMNNAVDQSHRAPPTQDVDSVQPNGAGPEWIQTSRGEKEDRCISRAIMHGWLGSVQTHGHNADLRLKTSTIQRGYDCPREWPKRVRTTRADNSQSPKRGHNKSDRATWSDKMPNGWRSPAQSALPRAIGGRSHKQSAWWTPEKVWARGLAPHSAGDVWEHMSSSSGSSKLGWHDKDGIMWLNTGEKEDSAARGWYPHCDASLEANHAYQCATENTVFPCTDFLVPSNAFIQKQLQVRSGHYTARNSAHNLYNTARNTLCNPYDAAHDGIGDSWVSPLSATFPYVCTTNMDVQAAQARYKTPLPSQRGTAYEHQKGQIDNGGTLTLGLLDSGAHATNNNSEPVYLATSSCARHGYTAENVNIWSSDGSEDKQDKDTRSGARRSIIRTAVQEAFSFGWENRFPWLADKNRSGKISLRAILDSFPHLSKLCYGNIRVLAKVIDGHQGSVLSLQHDRTSVCVRLPGEMFCHQIEKYFLEGRFNAAEPQNIDAILKHTLPGYYAALYATSQGCHAVSNGALLALLGESPYLEVDGEYVSLLSSLHLRLVKVAEWILNHNDIFEPAMLCPNARSRWGSDSLRKQGWFKVTTLNRHPYARALNASEEDIVEAVTKHSIILEMNEKGTMVRLRDGRRPTILGTVKSQQVLRKKNMPQDFTRNSGEKNDRRRSGFSSTSIRRLRLHLEYYFEDPATNRLLYNLIRGNVDDSAKGTKGCLIALNHIAQIGRVGSLFHQTCGGDHAAMVELTHVAISGSENLRDVVILQAYVKSKMKNWACLSDSEKNSVDLQHAYLLLLSEHVPFIREWVTIPNLPFDPRALVPPAECRGACIELPPPIPDDVLLLMQYNVSLTPALEAENIKETMDAAPAQKQKQTQRIGRLRREIAFHHCDVIFVQHAEKYSVNAMVLPSLLESIRKADSCDVTAPEEIGLEQCCQVAVLWNTKKLERIGSLFTHSEAQHGEGGKSAADAEGARPFASTSNGTISLKDDGQGARKKTLLALGLRRKKTDDVILALSGYVDGPLSFAEVSDFIEDSLCRLSARANVPKESVQLVCGISAASPCSAWPPGVFSMYAKILGTPAVTSRLAFAKSFDQSTTGDECGKTWDHLLIKGSTIQAMAALETPAELSQFPNGFQHTSILGAVRWNLGAFLRPEIP